MIKLFLLLLATASFAQSPFESKKANSFDLSIFNTTLSKANKKAIQNKKIKCRIVCDKKIYKEQKIADAISFYKSSKNYNKK